MIINPAYKTNKQRGAELGFTSPGAERVRIFRDESQKVYAVIPAYAGDGKKLSSQKAIIPFNELPIRVKLNQRDKHLFENVKLHLTDAQIIDPVWVRKRQEPVDQNLGFPTKFSKIEALNSKEDSEEVLLYLYGKMMDKYLPSEDGKSGYDILSHLYKTDINKQVDMYDKIIEAASLKERTSPAHMSNMLRSIAMAAHPSIAFAGNLNSKAGYLTRRFNYLQEHCNSVKKMTKHYNPEISAAAMKNYSASSIALASANFYKSQIRNLLNSNDLFNPSKHKANIGQIRLYNGKLGYALDGWRYPVCKLKAAKSEKDIVENLYAIPDLTKEMYKSAIAYRNAEKTSSSSISNHTDNSNINISDLKDVQSYEYTEPSALGRYVSTYA